MARVQRPRAPRGARPAQPAARAAALPDDLRVQPRRVLPGPDRRTPPAGGRGVDGHLLGRPDGQRAAGRRPRPGQRAHRRSLRHLHRAAQGTRGRWRRDRQVLGHPRAPRRAPATLPRGDLPGPDAARGGSRAPLPVHLDAVPLDRGRAARSRHRRAPVRPGQGPADPASIARGRAQSLRAHRPGHRGEPRPAVLGHGDPRAPPLPGDPQRGPRARGGRGRRPAHGDRGGASQAPLRRGGQARGRAIDAGRDPPDPAPRHRPSRGGVLRGPGNARPHGARRASSISIAPTSSCRPGRRSRRLASSRPTRTSPPMSSPPSGAATSSSITRTSRSRRPSSGSSPRPRWTPRS